MGDQGAEQPTAAPQPPQRAGLALREDTESRAVGRAGGGPLGQITPTSFLYKRLMDKDIHGMKAVFVSMFFQ